MFHQRSKKNCLYAFKRPSKWNPKLIEITFGGGAEGGGVVFKNAIFIAFSSVSRQFLSVSRQIKIKTEGEMSELTSRQILAALMVKTKPGHTKSGIWSSFYWWGAINVKLFKDGDEGPDFFKIKDELILNVFTSWICCCGRTNSADETRPRACRALFQKRCY